MYSNRTVSTARDDTANDDEGASPLLNPISLLQNSILYWNFCLLYNGFARFFFPRALLLPDMPLHVWRKIKLWRRRERKKKKKRKKWRQRKRSGYFLFSSGCRAPSRHGACPQWVPRLFPLSLFWCWLDGSFLFLASLVCWLARCAALSNKK